MVLERSISNSIIYEYTEDITLVARFESHFTYEIINDEAYITNYKNQNVSSLVIPSEIGDGIIYPVVSVSLNNFSNLTDLTLPESIKYIN